MPTSFPSPPLSPSQRLTPTRARSSSYASDSFTLLFSLLHFSPSMTHTGPSSTSPRPRLTRLLLRFSSTPPPPSPIRLVLHSIFACPPLRPTQTPPLRLLGFSPSRPTRAPPLLLLLSNRIMNPKFQLLLVIERAKLAGDWQRHWDHFIIVAQFLLRTECKCISVRER